MMTDEYKLTINANICFDYHPYEKTASEEVPYIVNHNEIEYYDEEHEIELTITPKMLLDILDFIYADSKNYLGLGYSKSILIYAFEKAPYYFQKICAEIFDEENLDEYTSIYNYLTTCDEFKKKEKQIIESEVRSLGELL